MILSGLTTAFWQLIIIRVLTGLGVGAVLVTNASMAAEYTPDRYRNLTVTAITAGYPFGAMAVGPFAAAILPEYGWRVLFMGGGAITICLSLLVVLLVPESIKFLALKRGDGVLERINKTLILIKREPLAEFPEVTVNEDEKSGSVSSLLTPDYKVTTVRLWSVFFLAFFTLYFMMSWIPRILIKSGMPEDFSGLALTLFNLGGVVGIVVLGLLTTRIKLYRVITPFLGIAATAMLFYAMFAGDSRAMILGLLGIGGFMMHAGFTGLYAVAARVYPTSIRSTGVGWGIGLGRVGAIIGPWIGGILVGLDWTVVTLFVVYSIPMYLAMWNARKLPV
jgi:MFS family permease